MISVTIEEFEQGTWIADLVDDAPYAGSFQFDGQTWVGTAKTTQQDSSQYRTRVVGGTGKLSTVIPDAYNSGSLSLQSAVSAICANGGEVFGSATPGVFFTSYERLRDSLAGALTRIAETKQLIWWIDRAGTVNVAASRTPGVEVQGVITEGFGDGYVTITEPVGLTIGATVNGVPVRHIRWSWSGTSFEARAYFVPFIFRDPTPSMYAAHYSARVDTDNGDGTIDVIAAGRFGVTKVPLYAGIPGAKITVKPGELVTLGFLNGDPQAPYAIANGQNSAATKQVARVDDSLDAGSFVISGVDSLSGPVTITASYIPPGGAPPPAPPVGIPVLVAMNEGKITNGSARVALDDG